MMAMILMLKSKRNIPCYEEEQVKEGNSDIKFSAKHGRSIKGEEFGEKKYFTECISVRVSRRRKTYPI
jgi:hypothetical protein